ncbi:cell wall-associated NlpC family hydrolase [Nocardiopsis sp. Huas11]|uniref:C40 family peptidase n=1 Tax=Nocardiopsis sp. Huas11 TaxID=2183912 RepID=UPI000EAD2D37|nr:C40 family peptidase [Nocardiopsis sp. Huas11]RKS09016.1 cell wall-associated NlpC family hydrolase [Nocardiopsis sp. Huas11]
MTRTPRSRALRRGATVGTVALSALVLSSGLAMAEPTQEEAQERYEELQQELSELNEAYNQAQEDHAAAEAEVEEVEGQLETAQEELDEVSGQAANIAQSAYVGADYSTFGVLFGVSPDDSLQNIADLDFLSVGQEIVLEDYVGAVDRFEGLKGQAEEAETAAAEALEAAEAAQEEGETALEEQEELVAELVAELAPQPAAAPSAGETAEAAAASGDVQAVLDFARAQIGKPYVWGGTGPDSYDCSGLVQAAWAQAGVSLPRTTYDQVNAGTPVSRDQLQPGDLLFFYSASAPSHVGIYSGNGMMIHGSNPSKPLEEIDLASYWDSVFTGAVRVG